LQRRIRREEWIPLKSGVRIHFRNPLFLGHKAVIFILIIPAHGETEGANDLHPNRFREAALLLQEESQQGVPEAVVPGLQMPILGVEQGGRDQGGEKGANQIVARSGFTEDAIQYAERFRLELRIKHGKITVKPRRRKKAVHAVA
jgi:hypothetical protein